MRKKDKRIRVKVKCQVELPGVMRGVGARGRPPSRGWFAIEVGGKTGSREGEIREIEQHKPMACIHTPSMSIGEQLLKTTG